MKLSDVTTLTFDCYGTLIDWESGMIAALTPLTDRLPAPLSRNAILQAHARHESEQQRQTPAKPYRDLLAVVYKRLAEEWGVPATWDECLRYGLSVGDWPAFPDTPEALAYLKQHYTLVILSNVDNQSFAASNRRLGIVFDAVFTAEDTGAYKPSLSGFHYMLDKLAARGIGKESILHTAESLFHDHGPANAIGLASCWIHRRHAEEGFGATMDPGRTPRYDLRFTSMAALAEAHRRERAGG
ncbi:haloacid dehalogenase type II [Methylobacterium sp. ID0610]|uniref:haloacid dehalogenase type II n=1 Tax=Methylobacterium carpenticola TaxID=3344827 RepID=UPI00367D0D2C